MVEQVGALSHDDADVRDRPLIDEMDVMSRHPRKVLLSGLQPPAILAHAIFAADDVMIRHHAGGKRFVEPHLLFGRRFVYIAPARRTRGPGGRNVRGHLALLHGAAHTTLQCATPNGRIVAAAALIIALEPLADLAEFHQVRCAADAAAQIREVEVRRLLLFDSSEEIVG